jgi:cysteinyl-tRNA synthetase
MKLYNTLTRNVEDLKPLNQPTVTMYTCGPTVYDYPHAGNWFTFIRYDLLVRTLKADGLEPKWVMNITDVGHLVSDADEGEDKLEKGARREGKSAWDVAKFYGDYFVEGLKRVNITAPTYLPKATDHISEQIELIQKLEEKGFTYQIGDGVYYDTSKFPRYADFARLDLDEQQAGARVEQNPEKRNPTDFALWKFSPEGQQRDMEWDSPWGKGFPGWHLECSAMSMKYLGETMDIHAGGIDHLPVHHTNEIAQSEAVTGKPVSQHWMHTNHITVNGEKISKSLGNGITLEDIEEKGFSLIAFRLHVLESHYRSQSKFSWESLEAASNRLKDYQALADLRFQPIATGEYELSELDYAQYQKNIQSNLADDLNTPEALRIVSLVANERHDSIHHAESDAFVAFLQYLDDVLGLDLLKSQDITDEQKQLVADRQTARDNKDWAQSDEIRDELGKQGIGVRDTAHGPVWYRA